MCSNLLSDWSQTEFCFTSLYLGHILKDLNESNSYILKIFLAASKNMITKCWLQRNPPTIIPLISIINYICIMDKMTFTIQLHKEKGDKYWKKMGLFRYRSRIYMYMCTVTFYFYFSN